MEIKLLRANINDAKELHTMQIKSFKELLDKYQDFDINPGNESIEKIEMRLKQDFTYFYFICFDLQKVGATIYITRISRSRHCAKSNSIM